MAGLLGAEQVAGAADLQVAHRDGEAAPELGVVGEGGEPRPRLRRQLLAVGVEEVGVGQGVAPADPPANLVELRQPERVGPLDDERVGLRDVEAGLDDRRRDEDVRVAGEEREHVALELPLGHLAVRDQEAELGAELPEVLGRLLDRLDAVVEVEGLAAAGVLSQQRVAHQLLLVLADVGSDRAAPQRRRLDDADVAEARQGHVQRPRNRRRREREDVELQPELAEQLLLRDAEALLLVDDHEPEVLGGDVTRRTRWVPMRTSTLPAAKSASTRFTSAGCGSGSPSRR